MRKSLLLITLGCIAPLAQAAEPSSGTLDFDNLELSYGGGPFVNANVIHQGNNGAEPTCMSPVLECDVFEVTLDFPEGIREIYPTALVRFAWDWDDLTGAGAIDFDFFITDTDGTVINNGGTSSAKPEFATILMPNNGPVTLHAVAVPFLALGNSYTATITVDLGEEAEVEETESSEGRSLSSSAGGAFSPMILGLFLLAIRRRRRS